MKVKIKVPRSFSRERWHGRALGWRGDMLVLASKNVTPVGVYHVESTIKGFTLSGDKFEFEIPAGVRTYGEAQVMVSSPEEVKNV